MSWLKRPASLAMPLALLIGLGACGFRPLYSERHNAGVTAELAAIRIDLIADRTGQKLHNFLLDRFNPKGSAAQPRYGLTVKVLTQRRELGIRKDETATRANLTLTASYTLRDWRTNRSLYQGVSRSTNSYNILESDFATLAALNDVTTRAARELSEKIKTRLSIYFSQTRPPR